METEGKYLMEKQKIYETAIATFGSEKQIIMLFEEMSELQKELCKHFRGKTREDWISEEIADVEIMLEQIKLIFNIENEVQEMKEFKIDRLRETLENA